MGDQVTHLSRGTDHLSNMASQLADLVGYPILSYELVQNADDAGAGLLQFRVMQDRLEVWNDACFKDCGTDDDICPWKADGPACDFHSFRLVASGNKAGRDGTTGKFGIGFISVYQLTDHPELISGGRHWKLNEMAPESERIEVCAGGCRYDHNADGTLFMLPYAKVNTALRQALKVRPLTDDDPGELAADLTRVAVDAILFLRHVEVIEVQHGDSVSGCVRTILPDGRVSIDDGACLRKWRVLETEFDDDARDLRVRYEGLIEPGRHPRVRVAVSDTPPQNGLLYAGLPTQTVLPDFPVRIDAEFYPTRDRKSVHLEGGHRGAWNCAALAAAAEVIAAGIDVVYDVIGPEATWRLIHAAHGLSKASEKGEARPAFGVFWAKLAPCLPSARIVPVLGGRVRGSAGLLLVRNARQGEAAVLGRLGIDIPDDAVRAVLAQLPMSDSGAAWLILADVVHACQRAGMAQPWRPGDPGALLSKDELGALLKIVEGLSGQPDAAKADLASVALVPCESGSVRRLADVCRLDVTDSRQFVASQNLGIDLVDEPWLADKSKFLLAKCPILNPALAVRLLGEVIEGMTVDLAVSTLAWLNDRRSRISPELRQSIAELPLFPSAGGLKPLTDLMLPGSFRDPLGFANLADLSLQHFLEDFLAYLGAERLELATYLQRYAVPYARERRLTSHQADALLNVISFHKSQLEGIHGLQEVLQTMPVIRCTDGRLRQGNEVYFHDAAVSGWGVPQVDTPDDSLGAAMTGTYEWLGVAHQGRVKDINERAKTLASVVTPTGPEGTASFINDLARHDKVLGWVKDGQLVRLKTLRWLPDEQGRRHAPQSIFPVFRRHLFDTQRPFLDVPRPVQNRAGDFLSAIGVPNEVPPALVIKHLRECATHGLDINSDIYRFLEGVERDGDLEAPQVAQLRQIAFIQTGPGEYYRPDEVFWDESPFGPYSVKLGGQLRQFAALLDKVGVKSIADNHDACRVLKRIAVDWRGTELEDDQLAVVHACWARTQLHLTRIALDARVSYEEALHADLSAVYCVPDRRRVLERPETLFFQDPGGVGAQSELLANSLIERHPDTWNAYQAAGVRNVSSILVTTVDPEEPVSPDEVLSRRLAERAVEIRRVLEAQDQVDPAEARSRLDDLDFFAAPAVQVRHEIHAFNRVEALEPAWADCHYVSDGHVIIRAVGERAAWDAVAREVTRALDPGLENHGLAGNLLHVLSADDAASASRLLTVLGIPMLSEATVAPVAGRESNMLGTDDDVADNGGLAPGTEGTEEVSETKPDTSPAMGEPEAGLPDADLGSAMDLLDGDKSHDDDGEDADSEEMSPGQRGTSQSGNAGGPRSGTASGPLHGKSPASRRPATTSSAATPRLNRMVSYVLHGNTDAGQLRGDEAADYSETDQQGVQAVLEYEERRGRHPREMEHQHPGFDIESADDDGKVVRRIEVKSLESAWGARGVALSRRQFDENWNEGPLYWLYVVEYATTPEKRKVYAVPDPASKATVFMFDSGWTGMAEDGQ